MLKCHSHQLLVTEHTRPWPTGTSLVHLPTRSSTRREARSVDHRRHCLSCASNALPAQRNASPRKEAFASSLKSALAGASTLALSSLLTLGLISPSTAGAFTISGLTESDPVYDGAGIVPAEKQEQLSRQLQDFEQRTGWRLRVFTNNGPAEEPGESLLRKQWRPDKRSVVVQFDPTSPNIMNMRYIGDEVQAKLRRPFWLELQSRYGNLFYVRDEGEQAAVLNAVSAITFCLEASEGCKVVPGLPADQYYFTLALSIAGGLVAGFVYKLEPQQKGFAQRRWVWLLIFSPLWASLFINFGLGPVISRTDDKTPVIGNTLGFLVGAFLPYATARLLGQQQAPPPGMDDGSGGGGSS